MKAVMLSVQPKWCELIASGKKTVEIRKTKPKLATPFKCYIYCTQVKSPKDILTFAEYKNGEYTGDYFANGKIIGEFVCNKINRFGKRGIDDNFDYCYLPLNVFGNDDIEIEITDVRKSCIPKGELNAYGEKINFLYAWHTFDLVIYDKPKELDEFRKTIDCHRGIARDNCIGCWDCELSRPPQSWCYVEELE